MSVRLDQLHNWIQICLHPGDYTLTPASEDASFRRYYRLQHDNQSFIIMDAPPAHEDCRAFINIASRLKKAGVNVPEVMHKDIAQGFLLMTDLGNTLYLQELEKADADQLYADAINALSCIQEKADITGLPPYDETLLRFEMQLFPDWLLERHLDIKLTENQKTELQKIFDLLVDSALAQPHVFVHRDYHSRNLMYCPDNNPGIVDFQDAVVGPVTYDLVSLLKDAYIKWPQDFIEKWTNSFFEKIQLADINNECFLKWFDFMGVQRQLKVGGIFARLYHRDKKPGYLKDIPMTLSYITDLDNRYPELGFLMELINTEINPKLDRVNRLCVQ